MVNEERDQIITPTPTFRQQVTRRLFEPHQTVIEVGARRQAHLISIITLLFAILNVTGSISIFFASGWSRNVFVLLGLAVVSLTGYVLSRTRYYKVSSSMIAWALVFTAFGNADATNLSESLYSNLIPAFILASITFPIRYMTIFVILNNLVIAAMPFVYPGYTNVGTNLGVFIPFSLLILAAMRHRDNVERDRLAKIQQINSDLTTLSSELEQRVEERTAKLEERARQLQAVTEVARTAATFQELERLLPDSTRLISESFGFYHVGIFLLDENEENAVLRAANSEGGERMLTRQHTLKVDLNSIVGYTAKTQTPRIALDTGADAVYFDNPDLPETRSEMAVPLKVGTRMIGVLDIQSTEKDAFSEDDIAIIGTLGDQLAVAIENTRLLDEARQALATSEGIYQRYFNQAWSQFSMLQPREGYAYQNGKVFPIENQANQNHSDESNDSTLRMPLRVRGQEIGILDVKPKNGKRDWSANEITLLEAAAERAALALEGARLLDDAQRRAARERVIGDISTSISTFSDMEGILRTAVQQLGRRLGGAEVVLELGNPEKES